MLIVALIANILLFAAAWAWCVRLRNFSPVDAFWAIGIGITSLFFLFGDTPPDGKRIAAGILIAAWSMRLGRHLAARIAKHHPAEDSRYIKLREVWQGRENSSFFWFFQAQAVSVFLLALPVDLLISAGIEAGLMGVRFGKGHGFFDAEWGMLYQLGRVTTATPTAAVVHDCQVLDEKLTPAVFDTAADVVFTPTRTIEVSGPHKPTVGILWDVLDPHMYETIPPLQQLKAMGL
jgi:hypothetical protein